MGFEIILLALLDDRNSDRRLRKVLLDPLVREIGIAQIDHSQYSNITFMTVKKVKEG
jgi:hypothetical protein